MNVTSIVGIILSRFTKQKLDVHCLDLTKEGEGAAETREPERNTYGARGSSNPRPTTQERIFRSPLIQMSHYPKHVMRRVIGQNEKYKNGSSANLKVANSTMADIKMNNFSFDDPKYVYNKHTAQDEGNTGCQNTNGPVQEVMSSD